MSPREEEFTVTWAMPMPVAADHEDAARRALAHIRRPGSLATVFRVTGRDGQTWQIDLAGEIEAHEVEAIVDVPGDHIIGCPLVHVVPSDKNPAAVFADQAQAEEYAQAAGEGWEDEHGIVCDRRHGAALIAEARGN